MAIRTQGNSYLKSCVFSMTPHFILRVTECCILYPIHYSNSSVEAFCEIGMILRYRDHILEFNPTMLHRKAKNLI